MDDLQDMENLKPRGEIQPVNAQRGQKGHNGRLFIGNHGITILSIWQMIERKSLEIIQC